MVIWLFCFRPVVKRILMGEKKMIKDKKIKQNKTPTVQLMVRVQNREDKEGAEVGSVLFKGTPNHRN